VTFSIVARDADGALGVAVASKFPAVGSVVPWARAGIGAIATQAYANVAFGPDGLAGLEAGGSALDVLDGLVRADPGAAERQVGIVAVTGVGANYTGPGCVPWAGGRTGDGWAVQGNILAGPEVIEAMVEAFDSVSGELPDRLLAALLAGDRAGGDRRGRQSAALLVVRTGGGYAGGDDRWIDLRVDDHRDPVPELIRLRDVVRILSERPSIADLLSIDAALAAELRERLGRAGWVPGRDDELAAAVRAGMTAGSRVGDARPATADWDDGWDSALLSWMGMANLEERAAARGWIDPVVLDALRRED